MVTDVEKVFLFEEALLEPQSQLSCEAAKEGLETVFSVLIFVKLVFLHFLLSASG